MKGMYCGLTLLLVVAWVTLAHGTTFDAGTGGTAVSVTDAPAAAWNPSQPLLPENIGYTTNTLIPHYQTIADAVHSTCWGDLIAAGHTMIPVNSLNPGDLNGLDRVVVGVVSPGQVLSTAQVDVIETFVLGGGKLVFLGENNNHFRDNNVAVGGRFGIAYPPVGGDPPETILNIVATHPIMQGPYGNVNTVDGSNNSSGYYGSMASAGPNGASILDFPGGNSACVVIEPGALGPNSGVIVAVAEVNIWDNDQVNYGDNRIFWNNIFAYCPTQPTAVEAATWGAVKAVFR